MKINETMKEWMQMCVIAACLLSFLFGMYSCMDTQVEKNRKYAKENPIEHAKERCYSKVRGSRPACWTEADWQIFCERVECKQR